MDNPTHHFPHQLNWNFVRQHPAHFIALGFGAGLARRAPGTVGTLVAIPIFYTLSQWLSINAMLGVVAVLFVFGIWVCAKTTAAIGMHDHHAIVWDEVVAFLLVMIFTPDGWQWLVYSFLLFRLFDIAKPPPIRYFDLNLQSGFGVMFDVLLAAGYTLIVLAVTKALID